MPLSLTPWFLIRSWRIWIRQE